MFSNIFNSTIAFHYFSFYYDIVMAALLAFGLCVKLAHDGAQNSQRYSHPSYKQSLSYSNGSGKWLMVLGSIKRNHKAISSNWCLGTLVQVNDELESDIVVTTASCIEAIEQKRKGLKKLTRMQGALTATPDGVISIKKMVKHDLYVQYDEGEVTILRHDIGLAQLDKAVPLRDMSTWATLPAGSKETADMKGGEVESMRWSEYYGRKSFLPDDAWNPKQLNKTDCEQYLTIKPEEWPEQAWFCLQTSHFRILPFGRARMRVVFDAAPGSPYIRRDGEDRNYKLLGVCSSDLKYPRNEGTYDQERRGCTYTHVPYYREWIDDHVDILHKKKTG